MSEIKVVLFNGKSHVRKLLIGNTRETFICKPEGGYLKLSQFTMVDFHSESCPVPGDVLPGTSKAPSTATPARSSREGGSGEALLSLDAG